MQRKDAGTCNFGVGIEAGMYPVAEVDTKYMDAYVQFMMEKIIM
jgi:non-canonical (house-cleaning) NTP pyrophosphatase